MSFTSASNEKLRWVLLAIGAALLEWTLLGHAVFKLAVATAQWSEWAQVFAVAMPRLVAMALLVAVFGPYQKLRWFSLFMVVYAALLLVRFQQIEVFVAWSDAIAASRATLPYVGGIAGALFGFCSRYKAVGPREATVLTSPDGSR